MELNLINGGLIMNVNTGIKQAVILAIGIIVLGFCVKSGLESVIAKRPQSGGERIG